MAHGGKDRHPFPVPTKVYDETIEVMRTAVAKARLGNEERLEAIRRLDAQSRRLERTATGPSLPAFLEEERRRSADYGGRSVFRLGAGTGRRTPHAGQGLGWHARAPARRAVRCALVAIAAVALPLS